MEKAGFKPQFESLKGTQAYSSLPLSLSLSRSNSSSDSIRKEALAYKTLETQKWLLTVKMVNAQCGYDVNTQNILWQRFTNYILNTSILSFVHLHDPSHFEQKTYAVTGIELGADVIK